MDVQAHPDWCVRTACTAYGVEGDDIRHHEQWHRSAPLVVTTGDPAIGLCVHRFAEADGSDEYIELAALELPIVGAWFLAEPVHDRTILLRHECVAGLAQAVAQLA
ncbi:hypothetical protein [Dactylosporangium sp. NPDC005555]|uniref:hypothetical protein n=1 Tax=Dactylosporangium sp. NPDC005555 TaxID=3154889 RepID=UPI0033BC2FAB